MIHKLSIFFYISFIFINLVKAESAQVAKPSFDCAKATTKVEKMICSDESGELQNLDRQLFKSYQETKAKLDKNGKKELLDSQKYWINVKEQCASKECVKKSLTERIEKLSSMSWDKECKNPSNVWNGTWTLKQNLYNGSFIIKECNKNNICKLEYFAILAKSEFNDMHICEVSMNLKIRDNKASAYYYDDMDKCELSLELSESKNDILITHQNPKDCDMGCGAGTDIEINRLYSKEL